MITQEIKKPIFRYHGGKWKLASWIISHMPSHETYVEPYCGAANVLLHKLPVKNEVINDLNERLISAFHVLRDTRKRKQLIEMLRFTPYARQEYENCQQKASDPLEDARRLFVLSHQSYASIGISSDRNSGWRRGFRDSGRNTAQEWQDIPDLITIWGRRLSQVYIERMDALELIKQTDSSETLFYVDPPYVHETRAANAKGNYGFEMTDTDHAALAALLNSIKGMAIISGYSNRLYERQLFPDWEVIEKPGASEKSECIWLSPKLSERYVTEFDLQRDFFDDGGHSVASLKQLKQGGK